MISSSLGVLTEGAPVGRRCAGGVHGSTRSVPGPAISSAVGQDLAGKSTASHDIAVAQRVRYGADTRISWFPPPLEEQALQDSIFVSVFAANIHFASQGANYHVPDAASEPPGREAR